MRSAAGLGEARTGTQLWPLLSLGSVVLFDVGAESWQPSRPCSPPANLRPWGGLRPWSVVLQMPTVSWESCVQAAWDLCSGHSCAGLQRGWAACSSFPGPRAWPCPPAWALWSGAEQPPGQGLLWNGAWRLLLDLASHCLLLHWVPPVSGPSL